APFPCPPIPSPGCGYDARSRRSRTSARARMAFVLPTSANLRRSYVISRNNLPCSTAISAYRINSAHSFQQKLPRISSPGGRFSPTASPRRTIRTGEYDGVAVGIAQPAFPVVRTAVAGRRIAVLRQDDFRLEGGDAGQGSIEIVDLKPQQHAVAIGLVVWIADGPVVMFDVKAVQLEDERAIVRDQALIFRTAVITAAAEETLVPAAAGFNVGDGDEGLGTHQKL